MLRPYNFIPMNKKTVKDIDLKGKRVFMRVDFNVPLEERDGKMVITDDTRIKETLPTLKDLITRGAKIERTLDGQFTLHGVTRALSIPVTARWNGTTVDIIGTAPIVLADYGIEAPQTPLVSVQGTGDLEIQLVLRRG